jgi:hypothetical protein
VRSPAGWATRSARVAETRLLNNARESAGARARRRTSDCWGVQRVGHALSMRLRCPPFPAGALIDSAPVESHQVHLHRYLHACTRAETLSLGKEALRCIRRHFFGNAQHVRDRLPASKRSIAGIPSSPEQRSCAAKAGNMTLDDETCAPVVRQHLRRRPPRAGAPASCFRVRHA